MVSNGNDIGERFTRSGPGEVFPILAALGNMLEQLKEFALVEGSRVVNFSQGGGSKDTWVLAPRKAVRDRELGAAEVVHSLPKSIPDPVLDASPRLTQKQSQPSQPQAEQTQQQQQQKAHQQVSP